MDLIKAYHDQESQSSSSGDDLNFSHRNTTASTSFSNESSMPNKVSSFEPIERIPIDRLMIATAAIAAKKPPKQKQKQAAAVPALWIADVEKELRMCLGSIQVLQKHTILESMDRFISKFAKDYEKHIKPSTADVLSHYIRTYLHIFKYLLRSMEKGKRYYKRFIRILAIYTDMELSASLRGTEYDKSIAERIVLNYQTYLDNSDNSMVLDVLINTKRLWRQHRGILVLLFEYFLIRKTPMELPDMLFMKNLIMFKKWLYIEEVLEERQKARDAFVKYVKPKKTLCMNSVFKPYLPLDEEGFITINNPIDILNKEYSLTLLIRSLKKAEVHLEVQQNEEVIILTDDEHARDEDESLSNQGASSASYSHHDESNDFDWYSASSQLGNQSSQSQNIVETVSIDSPPQPSSYKKTPSLSSLDSCDLNMDTTNSLATDRNGESQPQLDAMQQQCIETMPSTSDKEMPEANGENNRSLSTLDESMFNRLVNDINSTHLSVPGNGDISSDSKINENGESSQTIDSCDVVNSMDICKTGEAVAVESEKTDKVPVENEQLNGIMPHASESSPSNGESPVSTVHTDQNVDIANDMPHNHIGNKSPEQPEPVNICDNNTNIISSDSPLKNHEDTLRTIEEIVTDELKNHDKSPNECSTSGTVENRSESSPIAVVNDGTVELNKENANNNSGTVQEIMPQDFVPAAESTASVITETSLLTKSEQDVLFRDREAALIFNDLWTNGPAEETVKSVEATSSQSSRLSNDSPSPITFLQNGIDPNFRLKTYTRRNRKPYVETKTISTQTSRYSLSGCPSPVTTIDESDKSKKEKHLLTEKEDDELFLRDIFNTPEAQPRSGGSPRIRSPMYLASTPMASTPVASTSSAVSNLDENLQSTVDSSAMGSAEVPVKRKRGRPRKYPLPEPGTTPVVPKPPKAPRQPRQPRKPKPPPDPNETGEVEVFERMKLRERKPKIVQPPPEPRKRAPRQRKEKKQKEVPKEIILSESAKKERKQQRRRNTIKMTIDAIFNTQSPQFNVTQARRISQILGIPMASSKQIATILKRRNYNKTVDTSISMNNGSTITESGSMLQTFENRSNGQMNSTEPINIDNTSAQSTILARKTYIKPNLTFSTFSSLSSALRRISASRRISFSTRRISFSSSVPRHPVRTNNTRKNRSNKQSQQRYAAIDIFDTSTKSKRGRKKGTKDSAPRKKYTPRRKNEVNTTTEITNPIIEVGDKVNEETIELVDLTKEIAPFELDATIEINDQFANIHTALSSTQQFHNDSELSMPKHRYFRSDDTETDATNEFTTDQESAVEDTDDSHTRKSKRSRKRPKILDL